MDPHSKGWLKEFLTYRQEVLVEIARDSRQSTHPDHSLYKLLQPRGILYGQTVTPFEHPSAATWDSNDRLKIILAECLFANALHLQGKSPASAEEVSAQISNSISSISSFYNHVFPELATPSRTWLGKRREPMELAEKIFDKRVAASSLHAGNFWTQFFNHSLLFLDVYIFGQWVHTHADKIVSDFFRYEREELRTCLVKIIAAAAHANHNIEFEERKLLDYFLQAANLPQERRKECQEVFEHGVSVEELVAPANNSWILKKYFLETAILTVWADQKVENSETEFLQQFTEVVGLAEEDLHHSQMAIEGFALDHWNELGLLGSRKDFKTVGENYNRRLARVAEKNKSRLVKDARNLDGLLGLLGEARKRELTDPEKIQLQELLVNVLKGIPAFQLISLPRHYLTLPVLMQVLPRNFVAECLASN